MQSCWKILFNHLHQNYFFTRLENIYKNDRVEEKQLLTDVLNQLLKDSKLTIREYLNTLIGKIGENISTKFEANYRKQEGDLNSGGGQFGNNCAERRINASIIYTYE